VAGGTPIIGICGGYQMLGVAIHDADRIESSVATATGLSLLPVTSRFVTLKATRQIIARILLDCGLLARAKDVVVRGYEIHMGLTTGSGMLNPFEVTQCVRGSRGLHEPGWQCAGHLYSRPFSQR
jgi:adenosylcobyric acid synthase